MMIIIFILSTLGFGLLGTYYFNKNQRVKRRIEQFIPNENRIVSKSITDRKEPLKDLIEILSKNVKTSEHKRIKMDNELQSAGIPLKVEEFITIRFVSLVLLLVLALLFKMHFIIAIFLGIIGWKLPTIYLNRKKEARVGESTIQLPQALEIMANSMKSGFSFLQAMQLVSKEMPDPIGIEFQRTIKEINLGISADAAFKNLLQRLPNKDLEIVVTAVLIQRSTGGNLAQILETIHETISERVRMKDELKALTSQGRMSALVITLLPVFLGLILNLLNPDYFRPMLTHPLGWVLLGGGVVSGILGWIFIKKVVTIEV
jgi:tight adherence protein B